MWLAMYLCWAELWLTMMLGRTPKAVKEAGLTKEEVDTPVAFEVEDGADEDELVESDEFCECTCKPLSHMFWLGHWLGPRE